MRMRWTEEKDNYLRDHYPDGQDDQIAEELGASAMAVATRAQGLGLHKSAAYMRGRAYQRPRYNLNPVTATTCRCICWWTAEGETPEEIGKMLNRDPEEVKRILEECQESGKYGYYIYIKKNMAGEVIR